MAIYQHTTRQDDGRNRHGIRRQGLRRFKKAPVEAIVAHLSHPRTALRIPRDPGELETVSLDAGRDTARSIASKTVATEKDQDGPGAVEHKEHPSWGVFFMSLTLLRLDVGPDSRQFEPHHASIVIFSPMVATLSV